MLSLISLIAQGIWFERYMIVINLNRKNYENT